MNLCYHLRGLRTIVYYKPSTDPAYAGEVVEFEVRDDLPPVPSAIATPATPAAH